MSGDEYDDRSVLAWMEKCIKKRKIETNQHRIICFSFILDPLLPNNTDDYDHDIDNREPRLSYLPLDVVWPSTVSSSPFSSLHYSISSDPPS